MPALHQPQPSVARGADPRPILPRPQETAQAASAIGRVGQDAQMTDDEREAHIADCTRLMELAYARYAEDGNFADRGEADRWMLMRNEAVKGRSAAYVQKLEKERGLA